MARSRGTLPANSYTCAIAMIESVALCTNRYREGKQNGRSLWVKRGNRITEHESMGSTSDAKRMSVKRGYSSLPVTTDYPEDSSFWVQLHIISVHQVLRITVPKNIWKLTFRSTKFHNWIHSYEWYNESVLYILVMWYFNSKWSLTKRLKFWCNRFIVYFSLTQLTHQPIYSRRWKIGQISIKGWQSWLNWAWHILVKHFLLFWTFISECPL